MLSIAKEAAHQVGPRTQARWAYETIRAHIVAGRHTPNKKLKIAELADELRVSPGAVREALSRLVPERLVISRDQRGFVVAPLSISDLQDLSDLRCEIEGFALRRSVQRGDVAWEGGIIAAEHRLRATPQRTSDGEINPIWVAYHAEFHTTLVEACGNRRLLEIHAQLYEQSERYRAISAHSKTIRNVDAEHQEIVDMALARDADGLVAAMVAHIRKTTKMILNSAYGDEGVEGEPG
jgi:GntR family carbon starvation induced transcriptional regulator